MSISVSEPIGLALRRTGQVLFRPFRFSKWMGIALGAALWLMGEGGGGGFSGFNGNGGGGGRGGGGAGGAPDVAQGFRDAWAWILANLFWLIPVVVLAFLIVVGIHLLFRWLSARGTFMFFSNIVNNDDRVKAPWSDYRELGNSLFLFRIAWDVLWCGMGLVLLAIAGLLVWVDFKVFFDTNHYPFTGWTICAIIVMVLGLLGLGLVHWFLRALVFRMAVPVMFIRRMRAWPAVKVAWRELFVPNLGVCLLYFLFLIVVGIVRAIWSFAALLIFALLTCCCGCCLIAIPFVGIYVITLLALPVLTFDRAYCLHFVSQFGPEYRIPWQMPEVGGGPAIVDNASPPPIPPGN